MLTILWNAAFFIFALGILITIHELGHFWVARYHGVRVEKFSFGFGKALFSWHDKHGTEFVIAPILLGGYVKMLDVRNNEVPPEQMGEEFTHKSVWQRMAIMAAGPFANFFLAILLLWVASMVGQTASKPVIGEVYPDSIMAKAGVGSNSQIVSVQGKETLGWRDVNFAMVREIGGTAIELDILNLDTNVVKTHRLDIANQDLDQPGTHIFKLLGFMPYRPKTSSEIARVEPHSAAALAGLKVGDLINKVNGQEALKWQVLVELIQQNPGNALLFDITRDGQPMTLTVTPKSRTDRNGIERGFLGVSPVVGAWPEGYIIQLKYGFFESFGQGLNKTVELIDLSFVMIAKLFKTDVSIENLSGPISIAQGAGNSAERGVYEFLWFLALISVNLGVINLLPLPMLDGGHLFYYTIELIRGKSVSQRAQEIGLMWGAIVLFLLMGISLLNDISRLS